MTEAPKPTAADQIRALLTKMEMEGDEAEGHRLYLDGKYNGLEEALAIVESAGKTAALHPHTLMRSHIFRAAEALARLEQPTHKLAEDLT